MKEIKITSNGIKQAIDDLVNENEILQDKVYKLEEKLQQKEEIERLNKKIEQYENPEDMTLMFMWCNEKAKDEIERLNNIINELEKYLYKIKETSTPQERIMAKFVLKYIDELKGIKPYDELDEILELERDNLELKGVDKE